MKTSPYKLYTTVAAVLFFLTAIAWSSFLGRDVLLLLYLCAINTITLLLYAWDKTIVGSRMFLRVPERVLHGLALLGGSPMALVAQKVFRHKTRKHKFAFLYWIIVLIQFSLLVAWASLK